MNLRSKTRRRLTILLTTAVAGTAVLGGIYAWRKAVVRSRAYHARDIGYAAAKAEDYEKALPELGLYLGRFPNDPQALYYYALSREHVEEPNGKNLFEAVGLWRHLLDLQPANLDAKRQLLDLYVELNFKTETLDTANAILAESADDQKALRAKAIAFLRLRKFDDALKAIDRCNQLNPGNIENQQLALQIQYANGVKPAALVRSTAALVKAHPNDPRFEYLHSVTEAAAGDQKTAVAMIRAAAGRPVPDPKTLEGILRQLGALGLYREAMDAARTAAKQHPDDVEYARTLAERFLIAGDYSEMDSFAGPARGNAEDPTILAYKAVSLALQNRAKEASPLLDAIKKQPHASALALALAADLRVLYLDPDSAAPVDVCQKSLQADPHNGFLYYFLCQAYLRQGEGDSAIQALRAARASLPAWGLPLTRFSELLLASGQQQEALDAARQARTRAPNDKRTLLALADAWAAATNVQQAADVAKLVAFLDQLEARFPKDENLHVLRISLLARSGKSAEAVAAIREMCRPAEAPSEAALLQLAVLSQRYSLGVAKECFDFSEKSHGMSAELAYSEALWLEGRGKARDGLTFFESVRPKGTSDVNWSLAYARLLERSQDPKAKQQWMDIAAAFPNNLNACWAMLDAPSLQGDHAFLGKVIERIRARVGDQDVRGRLAQARWLLQGSASEKSLSEASLLLSDVTRGQPDLVQPRLLLANCMRQLGNISGAIEQLRSAAEVHPESNAIALQLASLLVQQGQADAARDQLDRVFRNGATPLERQEAASLAVQIGDAPRAVAMLEAAGSHLDASNGGVMLAALYVQQNQPEKAEKLCKQLMKSPTAPAIEIYANFLGSRGRKAEAEAVLGKLSAVRTGPGIAELIRANYLSRYGSPDDAIKEYLASVKAAPKEATCWRQLILFCLGTGRLDDAAHYCQEGLNVLPSDPGMVALKTTLPFLNTMGEDPVVRPLFAALLQSPREAPGILETIQTISAAQTTKAQADQILPKLRQLADRYPRVLAIQTAAVHYCAAAGKLDDAVVLANRAMQAFPTSPEAAAMASGTLAAAGHWNEALSVAQDWRQRAANDPLQADVLIADAQMQLGNVNDGLHQLKPYLQSALKSPDKDPGVVLLYAQGLIAANEYGQAARLLEPLLSSAKWRSAWINFADRLPNPSETESWLARVSKAVPAAASPEQLELALAYQRLFTRTHHAADQEHAASLVSALVASPNCDANTLLVAGSLYEQQNNLPAAETCYRKSLTLNPDQPIVLNNLAMVLYHRDPANQESISFVSKAIQLGSKIRELANVLPNFYDTQATLLAGQKQYGEALHCIDQAIKLAPGNVEWQANRVWLLAESGQRTKALTEFRRLPLSQLPESSRARLSAIGIQ